MDALTLRGDEGRSVAAISFGEVPSNLDPEISEWGNPSCSHETCTDEMSNS